MNESLIESRAKDRLTNKCKSLKLAKIKLALESHDAINATMHMEHISLTSSTSRTDWLEFSPCELTVDQEILVASVVVNGLDYFVLFFSETELVSIVELNQNNRSMIDLAAVMTINNFFDFLNTVPNMNKFVQVEKGSNMYISIMLFSRFCSTQ
ncbi:TPA: hypothetical protein ACN34E_004501 [Vibrio parahaemolyticus]|nr:hypothetical protein [Vibrio parahaemolyticus]ELA7521153.1 hypothetical protein [Vibrio parahaemolyticus]ELA8132625.1 hypothetical protein [Vibrio parahaemolyticus]ELC0683345.1 hypothetical protein [Vibrio parahaemolyticus]HAV1358884.1 hypothetical protein [Vibrio parahaemolyticus]